MHPQATIGRRISVRGVTGSGKSTLAKALGQALSLPVIELDAIHWQRPGWEELPREEFRAQVRAALEAAPNGWVIEGNYSAVADIYLSQIDTLVWIHLPWRVSFFRVVGRTFRRRFHKELLWGAQRESLWTQFFSKDSLFRWAITNHRGSIRRTGALMNEMTHLQRYELRSQQEVAEFLDFVRSRSQTPTA